MDNQTNYSQEFISQLNNAPVKKPVFNNRLTLIVIVLAGLTLVVGGGALVASTLTKQAPDVDSLSRHVQAVIALSTKYKKDLSNSSLRSVNSNLQLVLTNLNRELSKYSTLDTEQTSSKSSNASDSDSISLLPAADEALDNAKLNAVLDRAFVNEMSYLIDQEIFMIQRLSTKANSGDGLDKILKDAYDDLSEFKTQLTNLNLG